VAVNSGREGAVAKSGRGQQWEGKVVVESGKELGRGQRWGRGWGRYGFVEGKGWQQIRVWGGGGDGQGLSEESGMEWWRILARVSSRVVDGTLRIQVR